MSNQQPHHQPNQQQPPAQVNVNGGEDSFLAGFKGALGVIFALFVLFVVIPCGTCMACGGGMTCLGAAADYEDRAAEAERSAASGGEEMESEGDDDDKSGAWRVDTEVSEMDGSEGVFLSLESENQVEDFLGIEHRGRLIVRCAENETRAILRTGTQANPEVGNFGGATARIRLDDEEPINVEMSESTSGEALFFPGNTDYPRKFQGHEKLRFEFTPLQTNPQVLRFDLEGYDEVLPKVQKACNWE